MKLEINEVFFLGQVVEKVNISAKDAHLVSKLITKIEKEFERLQKLESKKKEPRLSADGKTLSVPREMLAGASK